MSGNEWMIRAVVVGVSVWGLSSVAAGVEFIDPEVVTVPAVPRGRTLDAPDAAAARGMIDRAVTFLRSRQDVGTGGWGVNPGGPSFPAITGLVVNGMLLDPAIDDSDPAVARGVSYMLTHQQPDGGIYDRVLPSYNTSICLSALSRVGTPAARDAVVKAQDFLRSLQFGEGAVRHEGLDETATPVAKEHPFYGGVGYGRHGRPDNSNLGWVLEGLHNSGVDASDPAFQRALVFLQRTQMVESKNGMIINDAPYARGSSQGGFIYATSVNKDERGVGQSFAGTMEETLSDGTTASRLRAYGSMTYSGFKSYLYAGLKKDDPRVAAAMEWIRRNYTVEENPGLGTDGMYYYYVVFARALRAAGEPEVEVVLADGTTEKRAWARDLIERLAMLQNDDGSFRSVDDRWMENDPVLITAYALNALQHAAAE